MRQFMKEGNKFVSYISKKKTYILEYSDACIIRKAEFV